MEKHLPKGDGQPCNLRELDEHGQYANEKDIPFPALYIDTRCDKLNSTATNFPHTIWASYAVSDIHPQYGIHYHHFYTRIGDKVLLVTDDGPKDVYKDSAAVTDIIQFIASHK